MFYRPNTVWSWWFLILVVIEAFAVLALEIIVFVMFQGNQKNIHTNIKSTNVDLAPTRTIPTYLTLFIFGHLFELFLTYDALRLKNTIQIIGLCLFNGAMLIYSIIQMDQIHEANTTLFHNGNAKKDIWSNIKPLLIAIPCIIAAITAFMSFVAWKLYDEFAWTIYKHISADLRMKRRYLTFQVFIALLKFDYFFFLGFTVQFIVIVLFVTSKNVEFWLTIAALPITLVILLSAAWFTRRENKPGMYSIITVFFVALGYFLFKLFRMYQKSQEKLYVPARKSLTTFAVITVLLIVATIINAIMCTMNFNKGLKAHITKRKIDSEEDKHAMHDMSSNTSNQQPIPSRMTID